MASGLSISPRRWRVLRAARRKAARWLRRREVVSIGIGIRRHQGRCYDEPCIVVTVDYKLGPDELRTARRRPLPTWLEVVVDGKRGRVRIDVQETKGQRVTRAQGLVGAPLRVGEPRGDQVIGSVSAVVQSGETRALLISGHVARERGRTLRVGKLRGVTREPLRTAWLDHCVVDVEALPDDAHLLVDDSRIASVREPASLRLREPLFFHRATSGERLAVTLQDVAVSAWVDGAPGGDLLMRDLVTTEGVSVAGDSGALLYDDTFRAVATLVGLLGDKSYFIPCKRALRALDLTLATKGPS